MTRQKPDHRTAPRRRRRVSAGGAALVLCVVLAAPLCADDKPDKGPGLGKPDAVLLLVKPLREVSGLAVSASGDLIAHNDELAKVWHISMPDGAITNTFEFKHKERSFLGDFEGVARVDAATWMINSRGFLFRAVSGEEGVAVYNTALERSCEIEGLAWWPQKDALLIACKQTFRKKMKGKAALYIWSLATRTLEPEPMTFSLKVLKKTHGLKTFQPSGVAVSGDGSELFVLSSKVPAIAVLSADGQLLRVHKLKKKHHPQPEGIALLGDGTLVIADEGEKGPGTLSLYYASKTR